MHEVVADGWDDVTAAQAQAIAALMTKPSVRAAAKSVGVGERTLYAWMKQPAFRRHFRDARKAVVDDSVLRLQKLTGAAVDAFKRSLTCGIPAIELKAAQLILGTAIEVQGLQDMADDLADLNLKMDAVMDKRSIAAGAVGGEAPTGGGAWRLARHRRSIRNRGGRRGRRAGPRCWDISPPARRGPAAAGRSTRRSRRRRPGRTVRRPLTVRSWSAHHLRQPSGYGHASPTASRRWFGGTRV